MKITPEIIELINERSKLNVWFNEYLDIHSDAMDELNNKNPIWKPYNINMTKYLKIENQLRMLNYVS